MPYAMTWWDEAGASMDKLEHDPSKSAVLAAVDRTLVRLSADPHSPRLGTIPFRSDQFGGVYATPVQADNWYVFWMRGSNLAEIEIVFIHQL